MPATRIPNASPFAYDNEKATSLAVTATIGVALAKNPGRKNAVFVNAGASDCYVSGDPAMTALTGRLLKAGGGSCEYDAFNLYLGAVYAICGGSDTTTLSITEGT